MGTTDTALQTQAGVRIGFVLAIEGFDYLITDQLDTAPAVAAWAGSGWTQAIPGLAVRGSIREEIMPWADTIAVPSLTFEILPDSNDTFGRAVWRTKPSYRSQLTDVFAAAADGSGLVSIKDTSGLPSSGQVFVGYKNVAYSGKSGTTLTVPVAGAQQFGPFNAGSGNHYSVRHGLAAGFDFDISPASRVQDVPTTWIGRRVGLYLHRIVGDVWDTRAQAHLEFAGRIVSLKESGPRTAVGCNDLRADIRDAVLLGSQWHAIVKRGIRLNTDDHFWISDQQSAGTQLAHLQVVASGASGTSQLNAGYYELGDFVAALNSWLAHEVGFTSKVQVSIVEHDDGSRIVIGRSPSTGNRLVFMSTSLLALQFLGYAGSSVYRIKSPSVGRTFAVDSPNNLLEIVSDGPPYVTRPIQAYAHGHTMPSLTVDLDSSDGEWVSHSDFLPEPFAGYKGVGDDYSFVAIGDVLFFARLVSATRLELTPSVDFAGFASAEGTDLRIGRSVDEGTDELEIRQVVVLADSFSDLMTRLLASTDGRGVNHATYDAFPAGMGCPGIPWELLGDAFVESAQALDQAKSESMIVVLDKPTKLVDLLMPELLLRFAWIVFKDGTYRFVSPPEPSPLNPDHVLTEDNKVARAGDTNSLEATSEVVTDHLRNIIKVEYNRQPGGEYRDLITVRDEASISDYGISQTMTISAPSSYADAARTGAAVEDLLSILVARTLPMFGRPMKTVRRTIAPTLYHMRPGDTVALSDELVRDPVTGARGLVSRGCIALSVTRNYGHDGGELFGEVELLMTDEDRTFPLSPCAQVDHTYAVAPFAAGYDAAAGRFKLVAHQHSRAPAAVDAAWFAVGDQIRIIEIDPINPVSVTAWDRQVAAMDVANSIVTLSTILASPAFNSALRYRVVPQRYSQVADSQKLSSYLAGVSSGLIQSLAQPNLYAEDPASGVFTRANPSTLPSRFPTESYQDGRPLHVGLVADHYTMLNNLVSYKTAPHQPHLWNSPATTQLEGTDFVVVAIFPFYLGGGFYKKAQRTLHVAPVLRISNSASTASLRVTSSARPPVGVYTAAKWTGAKQSITFTRTGTIFDTELAEQVLPLVRASAPQCTWITLELKTSNDNHVAACRGFTRFYLGPVLG
jgi:hypothetical protein